MGQFYDLVAGGSWVGGEIAELTQGAASLVEQARGHAVAMIEGEEDENPELVDASLVRAEQALSSALVKLGAALGTVSRTQELRRSRETLLE